MKITLDYLKEKGACQSGIEWCKENGLLGVVDLTDKEFLTKLVGAEQFDYSYWLIKKLFNKKQNIQMAIFAAEQVIEIYEKKYPDNKKPREAIEAAKKVLENDTKENRDAAYAAYAAAYAADAAYAAAYAAYAAAYAAYAAAYAAYAAAYAAYAADAAYAAAYAADAAAVIADAAHAAVKKEMKVRILNYAITLLEEL